MNCEALISVIIPIYNVEHYLEKCVYSIRNQTYRNLEIILVDDGSTDNSGRMCDAYAVEDSRIKVIHKTNGGLSSARNAGLKIASGNYIGFVDSDDYVDNDMYQELYDKCRKYDLDLITARFVENINGEDQKLNTTNEFHIFDGEQMIELNLWGDSHYVVTNSACVRLYRSEIVYNLKFPEGKKYEDICFSTNVFLKAKRCGYYDRIFYHYTIRNDSIMGLGVKRKKVVSDDFFDDLIPQMREQMNILTTAQKNLLADRARYNVHYELFCKFYEVSKNKNQKIDQKRILKEVRKDSSWSIHYIIKNIGKKDALIAFAFCYFPSILCYYWRKRNL